MCPSSEVVIQKSDSVTKWIRRNFDVYKLFASSLCVLRVVNNLF